MLLITNSFAAHNYGVLMRESKKFWAENFPFFLSEVVFIDSINKFEKKYIFHRIYFYIGLLFFYFFSLYQLKGSKSS